MGRPRPRSWERPNMATRAGSSDAFSEIAGPSVAELSHLEERLPPMLSVIAGMVDLAGFFTLGNVFTAHITGNLVAASALAVRGGPPNPAQLLAIPVFMAALVLVWVVARFSDRRGASLAKLLLMLQFLLLAAVLAFCLAAKPASNPHGVAA